MPVVLASAGLLFTVSAVTAKGTDLRGSQSDLVGVIRAEQRRADTQAATVDALRRDVAQAASRAGGGDRTLAAAQAAADRIEGPAGVLAVEGPALRVRLDDAPKPAAGRPLPAGLTLDDFVVHQQDVQGVVNALWRGGAEAMQVMDQRIVSTSAVRCVGNTLLLQGRVYSPPYTVVAIGDPERLRRELDEDPGVAVYRDYVTVIGLHLDVERLATARLPAYTGPLTLQHARAAG